jgi:spore germination cell wall hydrolase CwlJ-like protein
MKKNKLVLVSMIVFMTIFCLTVIFDIQSPITTKKGNRTKVAETTAVETETLAKVTEEPVIHSFAYDSDENAYGITSIPEEATASAITPTPEVSLAPTPEATPTPEPTKEPEKAKYANIGISIAKDYVNIREKPSTDADILGKLYKNSACEILDSKDGWYHVESGSVKGYVNSEFIQTGISDDELIEKYGTLSISVECDGLNVREEKSTDAKKLTVIYTDEIYPVVKNGGEWIEIKVPDEAVTGYVKSEFTKLIVEFKEAVSKEEEELLKQIEAEKEAKKETQIKKRESTSYEYDELQLLSCLIHAEAGSQSYETKLAVANVVLNRMRSYSESMKSVIYKPGQFTVAASGSLQKQLDRYDNYSSRTELMTIKAAKDALAGSNNMGSRKHFNSYGAAVRKGYDHYDTAVKLGGLLFWE